MKRIGIFPHEDISYVQYLVRLLEEREIECIVKNDNVAVAGLVERTAQVLSPEIWVVDDAREEEAANLVKEVGEAGVDDAR